MGRWLPVVVLAGVLWLLPVPWSFWPDEVFSAGVAARDLGGVLQGAANDRHPPLSFLLAWAFARGGEGDGWLRLAAGVPMLLALLVTIDAARRHLDERAALAAGAWFAASAVPALFAHTLRPYALATLAGAGLLWGALEAATPDARRARRGLVALAAAGLLAFWSHYAAVLVGVGAFLAVGVVAVARRTPSRLVGLGVAGVVVIVGCLPWALGPLREQLAERVPHGARAWETLLYLGWAPDPAFGAPAAVGVALGLVGAGVLLAGGRGASRELRIVGIVLYGAMLVLPYLASSTVPARLPRNFIGFFPAAALLAGLALDTVAGLVPRRPGGLAAAAALLLAGAPTAWMLRLPVHPQDFGAGHDYAVEARVLDAVIPADAGVRFQPAYVREHYARYAPALRERGGAAEWTVLAGGGGGRPCLVVQAFRVRLAPPASACEALHAALGAQADATGYPGLLLQRAADALDAGRLEDAEADLRRVTANPQRWPTAHVLLAKVAEARGDADTALVAYQEALRLARAYEPPGKLTASLWRSVARLSARAGTPVAGAAEAAECAATREPAWACGGWLAWATRPSDGAADADAAADAPRADAAQADAARADAARADAPRADAPRADAAGVGAVGAAAARWTFEAGVPDGWGVTGPSRVEAGWLVLGDGGGTPAVACSPVLAAGRESTGAVERAFATGGDGAPTWARVEARPVDGAGKALAGAQTAAIEATRQPIPAGVLAFRYAPPPDAAGWRLCVKLGGAAAGEVRVREVTVNP